MRCEQIRDLLSPYIDNMISEREKEAVEAHILACAECRRELEELQLCCSMLNKLDWPSVPPDFSMDLHRRLTEEKGKVFAPKKVKKPRNKGWIAAGIAGIALTAGIYASSFLPFAGQLAFLQEEEKKNVPKPSMEIEDVIQRLMGADYDPDKVIIEDPQIAENDENNSPIPGIEQITPGIKNTAEPDPENTGVEPEGPVEPAAIVADVYSTRIKVKDIGQSIASLIQIADSTAAQYALMPNGTTAQASQNGKAKEVVLTLDSSNVEGVLAELANVGKISEPEYENVVLTQQFIEADNNINFLKHQLEIIQSKDKMSDSEQAKSAEINKDLQEWIKKKEELEKSLNEVTLKIYLIEEDSPE